MSLAGKTAASPAANSALSLLDGTLLPGICSLVYKMNEKEVFHVSILRFQLIKIVTIFD